MYTAFAEGKESFHSGRSREASTIKCSFEKDEPLTEEQNDYMATTLMLMQTPLKWTVIESFLMSPLTQLFWKGFLIECWLTDGKKFQRFATMMRLSKRLVEVDQSSGFGL